MWPSMIEAAPAAFAVIARQNLARRRSWRDVTASPAEGRLARLEIAPPIARRRASRRKAAISLTSTTTFRARRGRSRSSRTSTPCQFLPISPSELHPPLFMSHIGAHLAATESSCSNTVARATDLGTGAVRRERIDIAASALHRHRQEPSAVRAGSERQCPRAFGQFGGSAPPLRHRSRSGGKQVRGTGPCESMLAPRWVAGTAGVSGAAAPRNGAGGAEIVGAASI